MKQVLHTNNFKVLHTYNKFSHGYVLECIVWKWECQNGHDCKCDEHKKKQCPTSQFSKQTLQICKQF